jgi:RIO kinase 1
MSAPALEAFFEEGWITEVSAPVKSGKEATVYCCQAGRDVEAAYLAAKVYRDREDRTFRNDAIYQAGRPILDRRLRRAVAKKTAVGVSWQFSSWIEQEFNTLCLLHAAGGDVPRPVACAVGGNLLEYTGEPVPWRRRGLGQPANAILMHFVGDEEVPAPHLQHAPMTRAEAHPLFERIMRNISLWLSHNLVHGDLSAFNILYWQGQITVIDFPQAVDARVNHNAEFLLHRDIENVCRFFARFGVHADPAAIARGLWRRYMEGDL